MGFLISVIFRGNVLYYFMISKNTNNYSCTLINISLKIKDNWITRKNNNLRVNRKQNGRYFTLMLTVFKAEKPIEIEGTAEEAQFMWL